MELEIKVLWCKGLTAFNFFQKLTVYAAVSITTEKDSIKLSQDQKQEQKTPVDDDGEGNPEWNHPMKFDLRPLNPINPSFEDLCLLFELRNHAQFLFDKTIGEVRVPLREMIQSVGNGVARFVSYEVRSPDRKHNGILDFSYKVIGNNSTSSIHHHHHHPQLDGNTAQTTNSETHVTGYQQQQLDGNATQTTNSDTHVTGYHHHQQQWDANTTQTADSDTHVPGYHHHHQQLGGNTMQTTNLDTHVTGYHHQQQQLSDNQNDLDTHVIGYHHHKLDESASISDSERIQYPNLDESASISDSEKIQYPNLEEHSAPPVVHYPPPSSLTATTATHHPPPALYPPPPPQMWAPSPPPPSHYPPPQPYVYPPPPPPQQQQPYGDPHWGYHRPTWL